MLPVEAQLKDTICIDVQLYKGLVIATDQGNELKIRVATLTERINGYETAIRVQQVKDSVTVSTYEKEIAAMKEQRAILEKIIRKERRKVFWGKVGAATLAAGAFWIGTKL